MVVYFIITCKRYFIFAQFHCSLYCILLRPASFCSQFYSVHFSAFELRGPRCITIIIIIPFLLFSIQDSVSNIPLSENPITRRVFWYTILYGINSKRNITRAIIVIFVFHVHKNRSTSWIFGCLLILPIDSPAPPLRWLCELYNKPLT